MRQHYLDAAVARATGESLRTIRQRGFSVVRIGSNGHSPYEHNDDGSYAMGAGPSGDEPATGSPVTSNH